MAANQVGDGLRITLVRDVPKVEVGRARERDGKEVGQRPCRRRAVVRLSWILVQPGNELFERLGGNVGAYRDGEIEGRHL